jgi:glutaredoxin 3
MNVKIYTRDDCPYCVRAKDFFAKKNISVQEVKVGRDIARDDYSTLTGMKSVPAIYIGNKLIGGYTDLVEYAADNPGEFI